MSTPRTPLPPEIYMRRRVAALVIILVLVLGLIVAWAALRGGGDDNAQPTGESASLTTATRGTEDMPAGSGTALASSAAATVASESSVAPDTAAGESGAAKASAEASTGAASDTPAAAPELEAKKATCELADLVLTASTDQPVYAAGAEPTIYMTVENPTAADCIIDLDQEKMSFSVYAMDTNVHVWTDTDCNPSVQSGRQTFKAGETRTFQAVWSRLASAPGQCDNREAAPAVAYFAHVVIGSNHSPSQDFRLL